MARWGTWLRHLLLRPKRRNIVEPKTAPPAEEESHASLGSETDARSSAAVDGSIFPPAQWSWDEVIERYVLYNAVGRGAYGRVYKTCDKHTCQFYAMKIYRKDRSEERLDQLEWYRSLSHPLIAGFEAAFMCKESLHVVSEFAEGLNLCSVLRKRQRIPDICEWIAILKQLCEALAYLHGEGFAHSDIKPDNILYNPPTLKLCDFDFLQRVDGMPRQQGTPEYVSPELVASVDYDVRANDMWAVGVIAYIMAEGYLPFDGDSQSQIFKRISNYDYDGMIYASVAQERLIKSMFVPEAARPTAQHLLLVLSQ